MTRLNLNNGGILLLREIMTEYECEQCSITLSREEQEYYSGVSAPHRRAEWLTSRVMLREELGADISTSYRDRAPVVNKNGIHISISHCDKYVAVMLSSAPCGVDIESSERNFSRVARRFLSEEERNWMIDKDIALAWTIKEAAYKMLGVPDIDFAKDFIIKKIDREHSQSTMQYNNTLHTLSFTTFLDYNITLCTLNTDQRL